MRMVALKAGELQQDRHMHTNKTIPNTYVLQNKT